MLQGVLITNEIICTDNKSIEELDRVLKHLTISGKSMSDYEREILINIFHYFRVLMIMHHHLTNGTNQLINDYRSMELPMKIEDRNEDQQNDDLPIEEPSSLSECLHLIRRLRLFSTIRIAFFHYKLTDALLDSSLSKQRSITDYFQYSPVEVHQNLMK